LLTEVLDAQLRFLFAGRTKAVEEFLTRNLSTEKRWVRLGSSGRIMTAEDFLEEG
jgi:hypothetical protein